MFTASLRCRGFTCIRAHQPAHSPHPEALSFGLLSSGEIILLKKQSDFLSNTADSSFCRIDVSFRWTQYMRYAQMRQTHIYKYQGISTHIFVLKVNLIFAWEMRRYKKTRKKRVIRRGTQIYVGVLLPMLSDLLGLAD